MQNFSFSKVVIEGHTDSDGDPPRQQDTSWRRARAVADWLVTQGGLTAEMVEFRGYGDTRPIAPNDTPENKQLKPAHRGDCPGLRMRRGKS